MYWSLTSFFEHPFDACAQAHPAVIEEAADFRGLDWTREYEEAQQSTGAESAL